ncbi:unnamed protein product [Dibothriocephalus latus]|uniref:Mannosyltransferase n=1 Tax=Dibothriocephalus latus TaxID=60516 RepID=A0A3P6TH59_DIBLA|nr:unnamed protein product [Dibothriocephalus latus]
MLLKRSLSTHNLLVTLSFLIICLYVIICPHNKVEESFNTQAIHDIIYYGGNVSQYDHLVFPGAVPRTFLGPLVLSVFALPLSPFLSKTCIYPIARTCLGLFFLTGLSALANAARQRFGSSIGNRFLLITASQFHIMFYASRCLPNTFAFVLVLCSLAALLQGADLLFIFLSGLAILVFRAELMLFYGPLLLFGLYFKLVKIRPALILTGLMTTLGAVGTSVFVDSFFWRRWLWPEGEVFYFNAIENKSSQWGVSFSRLTLPFYWYFVIGLPKALLCTTFLVILANLLILCDRRARMRHATSLLLGLEFAAVSFVLIYSFLPHKELRFVLYAVPILNFMAAFCWESMEASITEHHARKRFKPVSRSGMKQGGRMSYYVRRLIVLLCYLHLFVNVFLTLGLLFCSAYNYPGGDAISQLNSWPKLAHRKDVHVLISNLAAQTGVNRFHEVHPTWIYNKTEGLEDDLVALAKGPFTHLILETAKSRVTPGFTRLYDVQAFSGVIFDWDNPQVLERVGLRSTKLQGYPRSCNDAYFRQLRKLTRKSTRDDQQKYWSETATSMKQTSNAGDA